MGMISRLLSLGLVAMSTHLFACIGTVEGGEEFDDDRGGAGAASSSGGSTATTGNAAPTTGTTGDAPTDNSGAAGASGGTTGSSATTGDGATNGSGGASTAGASTAGASTGGSTGATTGGTTGGTTTAGGNTTGGSGGPSDAGVPQPDAGDEDVDAGEPINPIDESIMRGAGIYPAMCGSCHGADGSGGRVNEPLTSFTSVPQLSAIIDREMPPGNANACSATCAEDVARYIIATF
jgi:hypothetical protein